MNRLDACKDIFGCTWQLKTILSYPSFLPSKCLPCDVISQSYMLFSACFSTFNTNNPVVKRRDCCSYLRAVKSHAEMYATLWVFIGLMTAVVLAIAGQRLYIQVLSMSHWTDVPLVVAKTCGRNWCSTACLLHLLPHLLRLSLIAENRVKFNLKDWET